MEKQLRATAKKLLSEGKVEVVIGYGRLETGAIGAIFITNPDETDRLLWNNECHQNLLVYLTKKEIKKMGKPALVVKGCDAKAAVVLVNEGQVDRNAFVLIGMICSGMVNSRVYTASQGTFPLYPRCETCTNQVPLFVDVVIDKEPIQGTVLSTPPTTPLTKSPNEETTTNTSPSEVLQGNHARLAKLLALPVEKRLAYWKEEFSRCVKCYACRQNCPLCYCNQCVVDKNRPVRIDTSATLKGNFAWNILRAFHLAGRCIGCGACTNACPVGIDLDLLNLTLAETAKNEFNYVPGTTPGALPLIGTWSEEDKENFIR